MSPVRAYRIKARVQNNRLWRAVLDLWPDVQTQSDAARRLEMSTTAFNGILNMRRWPYLERSDRWSSVALYLSSRLAERPEVLFDRGLYGCRAQPIVIEADRPALPVGGVQRALAAPEYERPDVRLDRKELAKKVREVLGTLRSKEQRVLALRYGLDGDAPRTLEAVAAEVGASRERVRQIEASAFQKLRHPAKGLAAFT